MKSSHGARRSALLLLLALVLLSPVVAAQVDIELSGAENDHGLVRVAGCTPETFTRRHCPLFGLAPAKLGSVTFSVEGIPGTLGIPNVQDTDRQPLPG